MFVLNDMQVIVSQHRGVPVHAPCIARPPAVPASKQHHGVRME